MEEQNPDQPQPNNPARARGKWLRWLAVPAVVSLTLAEIAALGISSGAVTNDRKVRSLLSESKWTSSEYWWLSDSTVLNVESDESSTRFVTYDLASGRRSALHALNHRLDKHPRRFIRWLTVQPNGKQLVWASFGDYSHGWITASLDGKKWVEGVAEEAEGPNLGIILNDGRHWLELSQDKNPTLIQYSVDNGIAPKRIPIHAAYSLSESPGKQLLGVSSNGTVIARVVKPQNLNEQVLMHIDLNSTPVRTTIFRYLVKENERVIEAAYSPNRNLIAWRIAFRPSSGFPSGSEAIRLTDVEAKNERELIRGSASYYRVAWRPDGKLISFSEGDDLKGIDVD